MRLLFLTQTLCKYQDPIMRLLVHLFVLTARSVAETPDRTRLKTLELGYKSV